MSQDKIIQLLSKYGRAELGVDGNAGFALLGGDLQEGEAEFVEVSQLEDEPLSRAERRAAGQALVKLRARLSMPNLSYYLGRGLST